MPLKRLVARVRAVVVGQLVQGATPRALALTVALGMVLGVFPIIGATTVLCLVAAWALRLNQPVMQVVNLVIAYPLHLTLLIPFYAAGQRLFDQPAMALSLRGLTHQFHHLPLMEFVSLYGAVALRGIVVWALVAGPAAALIFLLVRPVLERMAGRQGRSPSAAEAPGEGDAESGVGPVVGVDGRPAAETLGAVPGAARPDPFPPA